MESKIYLAPVKSIITFQCEYADTLAIESSEFTVNGATSVGTATSGGSLKDGFRHTGNYFIIKNI